LVREIVVKKPTNAKPVTETAASQANVGAVETVPVEAVAEEPNAITVFQFVTYASFVLNFLLAGAVAVILFKKAAKLAEERFVTSAKTLGVAAVLIMLHGFFATYLYASYLNDTLTDAPLFLTMAIWVLAGPAVGFISRTLLARQDKPNRKAAIIDGAFYAFIFFLAACGVSSGIKTNAALLSSLLAGFLMIVPIARSMTAYKVARARHKELKETSDQILLYSLLFIPALLPVLSFAHVCGLSDSLTLFLINFITFDFLLVVALSMIASAEVFIPEAAEELAEGEPEPVATGATAATAATTTATAADVDAATTTATVGAEAVMVPEESAELPEEDAEDTPAADRPAPQQVGAGNPDDPIIQFLNSEEGSQEKSSKPAVPVKPAANNTPRVAPPRKPGQPGITPPKKPGSAPKEKSAAPNAPSRLRAPAKPKKRY
jgi:hypothetical protein